MRADTHALQVCARWGARDSAERTRLTKDLNDGLFATFEHGQLFVQPRDHLADAIFSESLASPVRFTSASEKNNRMYHVTLSGIFAAHSGYLDGTWSMGLTNLSEMMR